MQKFISKYGLAAHLAILAVAPLFLSPVCVFWLSALAAVWLFMEPSRIGDEYLDEARQRVLRGILRDPVFWLSAVVVASTAVCFWNSGIRLSYEAESQIWSVAPPPMPILPGSVSGHGAGEFAAAIAFAVVVQGCRHGLGRAARQTFLICVSLFTGIAVAVLSVMLPMGYELPRVLVECSTVYPYFVGMAFGLYMLGGTVGLICAYENKWLMAIPLAVVAIGGNAAGVFLFAPACVSAAFAVAELLLLVYSFVYALKRLVGSGEFKFLVAVLMALTLAGVLVIAVLPEEVLKARLSPFETGKFFVESFVSARAALSAIAFKAWKASPWLGSGLGSFPLDLRFLATESDWSLVTPEQTSPLNGYWQLLSEQGLIGVVLIVCPLGLLLWSFVAGLIRGFRHGLPHPSAWLGLLALLVVLAEMSVDASFLLPGAWLAVASFLAISANSFPKEKRNG